MFLGTVAQLENIHDVVLYSTSYELEYRLLQGGGSTQ